MARAWVGTTDEERFQAEIDGGSQYLGSAETVATKVAASIRLLGLSRFDLAYATGAVPHEQRMAMIDLYGREVIPRVRELLAETSLFNRLHPNCRLEATPGPGRSGRRPLRSVPKGDHCKGVTYCDALR